jgi:hypothetical protein
MLMLKKIKKRRNPGESHQGAGRKATGLSGSKEEAAAVGSNKSCNSN